MRQLRYGLWYCVLLVVGVQLSSCGGRRVNERFSLWRKDKDPYGTWYSYQNLSSIFPDADIVEDNESPNKSGSGLYQKILQDADYDDSETVQLIITTSVLPDSEEVEALIRMARSGRQIFISALEISPLLLDTLGLASSDQFFYMVPDTLTVSVSDPERHHAGAVYTYPGKSFGNYFTHFDSTVTRVLGTDKMGRANFVQLSYEGGGAVFLHLAPTTFTNFFLLHKQNKGYYDAALSFLRQDAQVVRWDDYFRYHSNGDSSDGSTFSALSWMNSQPPLRWAILLLLLLLLLIYLVESKRRQRIIPPRPVIKNASLDFAQTIGRLYYQRRDNKDLAAKMTAHFLDHVRTRYNISTTRLDDEFEARLASKSSYPTSEVKAIVYHIRLLQDMPDVSDEDLMILNERLEKFYKHA